jgi:hypothetical protein
MPCRSSPRSWSSATEGESGASRRCLRPGIGPDLRSSLASVNFGSRTSLIGDGDGGPQPSKIGASPIRTWGEWTWSH